MTKTFRFGFTGNTLDAALPWIDEQVGEAAHVSVTMAGSGKDIAHLAREGRTIQSWDTQVLSKYVVRGVFAADPELPRPHGIATLAGYATEARPIRGMPDDAAGVADYIATEGSDYDRVCLASALVRSTFQGRLSVWMRSADAQTMYDAYLRAHKNLSKWRGLPGTFQHTHGSVFDHTDRLVGSTVLVDTPKVLSNRKKGGDIYSQGWNGLNSILAQVPQELPPWTEDTFKRDMPLLWNSGYARLILFHSSGARPGPKELHRLMVADGAVVTGYQEWDHHRQTDMAWVLDRASEEVPW